MNPTEGILRYVDEWPYQPNLLKVPVFCDIRLISLRGSSNLRSLIMARYWWSSLFELAYHILCLIFPSFAPHLGIDFCRGPVTSDTLSWHLFSLQLASEYPVRGMWFQHDTFKFLKFHLMLKMHWIGIDFARSISWSRFLIPIFTTLITVDCTWSIPSNTALVAPDMALFSQEHLTPYVPLDP